MSKRARKFQCVNDPNLFCYVCGEYTAQKSRNLFSDAAKDAFTQYFGMTPDNLDEAYTPNDVCHHCYSTLTAWVSGAKYVHIPTILSN